MLSTHKMLLRCVELVSIAAAAGCLASAAFVSLGLVQPSNLEPYLFAAFALMFVCFMAAVLVITQFTKVTRAGQSLLARSQGLSLSEVLELVRWCPKWMLGLSLVLACVALAVIVSTGGVSWHSDEPLSSSVAVGLSAGLSLFFLTSVPVLSSASRMPGTFSQNARSAERHGI